MNTSVCSGGSDVQVIDVGPASAGMIAALHGATWPNVEAVELLADAQTFASGCLSGLG